MFMVGPIGFVAPWLLISLIALPILWLLLRAVPPAPIKRRFPGVALLLGLSDDETQTDKTPWWLMLLRMLAVAAAIIGFAGPVLNPDTQSDGTGPLLIVVDGAWADARDWSMRIDQIDLILTEAQRVERPVALALLSDAAQSPDFSAASTVRQTLSGITPNPWALSEKSVKWAQGLDGTFDTYWVSNGVASDGHAQIVQALSDRGDVTVFEIGSPVFAMHPPVFEDGVLVLSVTRLIAGFEDSVTVSGFGLDPTGTERSLIAGEIAFDANATRANVSLNVQPELRNRMTRFAIVDHPTAAGVSLVDDSLKRREVALIAGRDDREGLELLSPLHYLEQALVPTADLVQGTFDDLMLANPDAIVMADVATVSDAETQGLLDWIAQGGLLVRFAGPRLAASDVSRAAEDPLMPVRLRQGGRTVGGAMSWGAPKRLRGFDETSPFFGLSISEDIVVTSQVMAQPDPDLSDRVIAALEDGTPLVTRKRIGDGAVILFHVTANAEWSSLPLSGLFVQMLERLAVSSQTAVLDAAELEGTTWAPVQTLSAFGLLQTAGSNVGLDGAVLADRQVSRDVLPGLYQNNERRVAMNVIGDETTLSPTIWPASIPIEGPVAAQERVLKGWVLSAGLILLALDVIASLWLSGCLRGSVAQAAVIVVAGMLVAESSWGQSDDFALNATNEVVLGYVITGDSALDEISQAGMQGISDTVFRRTSIEPANPIGVNLETDELAFFPFLYWPISPDQAIPSPAAYTKLNRYLRTGGMILFDTRDGNVSGFGSVSPTGRKLQSLARPLDIPPLEPIPSDHVLTRSFYLLQDFPGRYVGADVWVEAAPEDAELAEGMPFRNLNDGVTPVVIGGNDWAGAWATLPNGSMMFPVGRGYAGERQREFARRFGVNLIMHVLTGNYKSDQVHVPALLERLGQ